MLKNYFRIAFRTLMKHKAFSFINVFGLAAAIACCMLIAAFVYDELHYDTNPGKAKQIYRVGIHVAGNGSIETYVNVDVAVGKGIKDAYPEVEDFTRVLSFGDTYLKYSDKQFKEQRLVFTDANFPTMFSLAFVEGDPKTALSEPNSMVITHSFAKKYFGDEKPIGKMLTNNKFTYKVTAVMEDMPANAHFHFDGLMSMATLPPQEQTWSNISFYTYLQLKENTDPKKLEAKFPDLVREHVAPETARDMGVSLAEALKTVNTFQFFLQPLTDIHLHSNTKYELEANGDISYVYIFSGLAIFILILACVNFTNLSTASAAKRAREVGVRKVLGSLKKQLVSQFLAESILLTLIAVVVAFAIVYLLLPYFNDLAGKQVSFGLFFGPVSLGAVLLLALLAGVLAGIYPAFFLSSFNVIRALKSKILSNTGRKSMLRSGLVVFQFAVSTSLIIATLVVYRQLHYMQNKKLGYDKEQVLFLQDTYLLGDRSVRSAFKNQLIQDSRVVSASIGTDVPGNPSLDGTQAYAKDKSHNENASEIHINIYHVDYDYIPTIGLKIIQGRNFAKDFGTDSAAVIINETAVRELGWAGQNPIGKTIVRSGRKEFTVIGVVSDFHYTSVKQKIAPLMIMPGNMQSGMIVKIKTTDVHGLLGDIKKQWDTFSPGAPFAYYFLDDKFAALYTAEQKTGQIFTAFAIVAILIAGMGLFGLATFITEQRTKEIGVRKVFGASVPQVLALVSKEFLWLVMIAFVVAAPVTWWGMHTWLQHFAYRTPVNWWLFAIAGIIALVVALLTVSLQAIKAAIANPVKSLRTE